MKYLRTLFGFMAIVGSWLFVADALGYTKPTSLFGFDLWKPMFVLVTLEFTLIEINKVLEYLRLAPRKEPEYAQRTKDCQHWAR